MLAARLRAGEHYDDKEVGQFLDEHEKKLAKMGGTELATRVLHELTAHEYPRSLHGPN